MKEVFVFPLQQHKGAPSIPCVRPGAVVKRGACIAKQPDDALGSNIFSSIDGTVLAVNDREIRIGADPVQHEGYIPLTAATPLGLIKEAGIVGLGGAGFPTYAKLNTTLETGGIVIANAAECEPILGHNIKAIERNPKQLLRGLEIVMQLVHVDKGVIAIKAIHGDAIRALQQVMDDDAITLHLLPNMYPVGDSRAVVHEVTGTLLPLEHKPHAANAIVINSESLCRIEEAVDHKKPFIDKDLTVAGKVEGQLIQTFHNVPLGKMVRNVLAEAGGLQSDYGELIMDGPFMGHRTTLDAPIVKTTGGIIATEEFMHGPEKIGLLVCACGGDQKRLQQIADSMGSKVVDVEFCKQAHMTKRGILKCDNPGHCPGQVEKVMAIKKAGAEGVLISNCMDCTNTVMSCAPKMHLPVYHCTDGALRAVNHKLIRRLHQ